MIKRAETVREADQVVMELWDELKLAKAGPGISPEQPAASQPEPDERVKKDPVFLSGFLVYLQISPPRKRATAW